MKIAILDTASLGGDVDLSPILNLGEASVYEYVAPEQIPEIVADAEVIVYNKTKLTAPVLEMAKKLTGIEEPTITAIPDGVAVMVKGV